MGILKFFEKLKLWNEVWQNGGLETLPRWKGELQHLT